MLKWRDMKTIKYPTVLFFFFSLTFNSQTDKTGVWGMDETSCLVCSCPAN